MSEPRRKLSIQVPALPWQIEADEKKPPATTQPEGKNLSAWAQAQHDSFIKAAQSRWAGSE